MLLIGGLFNDFGFNLLITKIGRTELKFGEILETTRATMLSRNKVDILIVRIITCVTENGNKWVVPIQKG